MNTPRRSRLDLNEPAEIAIRNAVNEIEKIGADTRLTEAVMLLAKAKDLVSDFIDKKEIEKDSYTYVERSKTSFTIYKNNLYFGAVGSESEAKYTCYALENFDSLEFACSATCIVLYLDGRSLGELKVNYLLAKRFTDKLKSFFKTAPEVKGVDMSDVGWEYDR